MAKYSILVLGCLLFLASLVHAGVWRNERFVYNPDDLNGFDPDQPNVFEKWDALKKNATLHGLVELFGPFNIAEYYSRIAALVSPVSPKERIDGEESSDQYEYAVRKKRDCEGGCNNEQVETRFNDDFPYGPKDEPEEIQYDKNLPYEDRRLEYKTKPTYKLEDYNYGYKYPYNSRPQQKPRPKQGIDPLYALLANLARKVFHSEAAARFFENYKGL